MISLHRAFLLFETLIGPESRGWCVTFVCTACLNYSARRGNRYLAQLLSPEAVRFTAPGSARHRQVSAYQKGLRPKAGSFKGQRAPRVDQTPTVKALFATALEYARKKGPLGFEYDQPWTLWRELLPEYQGRVTAIARRADELSLGDYALSDFNQFYAAFLAVCAAHEFLCFAWAHKHGDYPLDSAVMVRSKQGWTTILSELSGITSAKCQSIISDLSFDFARSLDLHVHPFVRLGNVSLAVAPQFPLHSRPDDAGDLSGVHAFLRDAHCAAILLRERSSLRRALPALKHARVSFARVRKGLPLPVSQPATYAASIRA